MKTVKFNKSQEPIVLSKALFDLLLATGTPAEAIALYSFYYYTAKWQNTHDVRATTGYVAKGLKWTEEKVRKIKKVLLELGLIVDAIKKDELNKIIGHYVELRFIWEINKPPLAKATLTKSLSVANQGTNALTSNKGNALTSNKERGIIKTKVFTTPSVVLGEKNKKSNNKPNQLELFAVEPNQIKRERTIGLIQEGDFETFYKGYPKHVKKGQAKQSWEKLCSKPKRPTLQTLVDARDAQIKTVRWEKPNHQFVPDFHHWMDQQRWLDEIEPMNRDDSYKKETQNKPTFFHSGETLKYKQSIKV